MTRPQGTPVSPAADEDPAWLSGHTCSCYYYKTCGVIKGKTQMPGCRRASAMTRSSDHQPGMSRGGAALKEYTRGRRERLSVCFVASLLQFEEPPNRKEIWRFE